MTKLKSLVFHLVLITIFCNEAKAQNNCNVQGYYWRDYTGEIPDDALEGGSDTNGKPIYIGQAFAKNLIPAKIYSTDKNAYYELGGSEHATTQNVKILCTQHPEQFEWIETNNDKIKLITDKKLVIGGYEPGATTYIGRAQSNGETIVGKVLTDNFFIFSGLWMTSNSRSIKHTTFEVLAFNPSPKIDIRYITELLA